MDATGHHTVKALAGLIGSGIGRSLTPAMQEEEARQHGLRLHYQLIDIDRIAGGATALPRLLEAAALMGFCGLNITHPCKQAVVPLLDELSEEALAIGAVNTVVNREGRLTGYNTDSSGWRWGFESNLRGADLSKVVLLGAGGAGSAIAHALLGMETGHLFIFDRAPGRAQALAQDLAGRYGAARVSWVDDLSHCMAEASGLVHATPTGTLSSPGMPLPPELLRPALWVSEVVYFPLETELLKAARRTGCATVDGGAMAVGQAIGAFEHFTGMVANAARVKAHFARLLTEQRSPAR